MEFGFNRGKSTIEGMLAREHFYKFSLKWSKRESEREILQ